VDDVKSDDECTSEVTDDAQSSLQQVQDAHLEKQKHANEPIHSGPYLSTAKSLLKQNATFELANLDNDL
jgi:hypothetical protein